MYERGLWQTEHDPAQQTTSSERPFHVGLRRSFHDIFRDIFNRPLLIWRLKAIYFGRDAFWRFDDFVKIRTYRKKTYCLKALRIHPEMFWFQNGLWGPDEYLPYSKNKMYSKFKNVFIWYHINTCPFYETGPKRTSGKLSYGPKVGSPLNVASESDVLWTTLAEWDSHE